jgi:RNA polymerase sigma-32 factor
MVLMSPMADLADDLEEDEGPALAPEIVEDEDDELEDESDEGEVVDVGTSSLARSRRVRLADEQTDWVKDDDESWKKPPPGPTGDLYRTFVREATRYKRLTESQERALGLKVRDHGDKDAAKKLVVHNLRLALKMAHQHRRSWTNLMDLVQEASTGMAIAAERWDPDQGTRFGTYAVYWIRAQLTKFLMRNGRVIHTGNTRAGRKLYYQLPRIRRRLLADGKEPSIANIAKEVGEDEEEVARVVARLDGREASLSAQVGDGDGGSTLGDLIEGDLDDPEAMAGTREMQELMAGLVERFASTIEDERDRAIWFDHLTSSDPTSLVDLGKRYGVSKQRMGQLATRLKRAFRRHVIDELGPQTQLSWLFTQE